MEKLVRAINKSSKQYHGLLKLVQTSQDTERKKRTVMLIQLGGILDVAGVLNYFKIFKGDDVENDKLAQADLMCKFIIENVLPPLKNNPYEWEYWGKSLFIKIGINNNSTNDNFKDRDTQEKLVDFDYELTLKKVTRKQKLRTLIQVGALAVNTGILKEFDLKITDDLQNQNYSTACAILGALRYALEDYITT